MSTELDRLKTALADRYEIEREVGAGGMATVYLARDVRHERKVALKVLRPDLAASLGSERFLQEVRVTANLQHPHILPLFDSGEADGFLFYVMPFIDGESLRQRLSRERELPVPEAARLLRDVVDALAAAHRAGVVHRDIKPENILLSGRHAMVADFGVAKAVSEATGRHRVTTMGVALGTPAYMAPEQAAADANIDHRADIYAIGAMAYELLAGRPPITGTSPQAVLTAQVTKNPDPLREHRTSVPPELESLIMRCLEKKPADRWQTAEEMLPYLEAAATPSGGMTPTGTAPVLPAASPFSRLPRWVVPAGGVLIAAVASVWALGPWGERGASTGGAGSAAGAGADADLDSLRIVVLPFVNRTGHPEGDTWGELAAETTARLLAQGAGNLDVPTSGDIRAAGMGDDAPPGEAARRFGARYVVGGRITAVGDEVRFDAEMTDAATGQMAVTIDPIRGRPGSIESTVEVVGERMAAAAAGYAGSSQVWSLRGWHPPSTFESLSRYTAASDAFCRGQYSDGLALLEEVLEADPAFTAARIVAIPTYGNGGRSKLTRDSILALAREAVPRMTQVERLMYTWQTATGEEELRAIQELRRVSDWGQSVTGYPLAYSAVRLNRITLALEGVEEVDYDDPCYRQWSPLWAARTVTHHLAGNYATELTHAREWLRRFPRGTGALWALGRAAAAAGELAVLDSAVEATVAVPTSWDAVVNVLVVVGQELETHGYGNRAREVYRRAHDISVEQLPEENLYRAQAALRALPAEEALPTLERAAAAAPTESTGVLGLLALALERMGRSAEADELVERMWVANPRSRAPAAVAAARADGRGAAEAVRRALAAGQNYYTFGSLYWHHTPEFGVIREDPAWQSVMRPRD